MTKKGARGAAPAALLTRSLSQVGRDRRNSGVAATLAPGNAELPPRNATIAVLAARQHGAVATRQLYAAGLSATQIRADLRSGRLHRLHRGVYAVGYRTKDPYAAYHAAALAIGDEAVVSHLSAAQLWGLLQRSPGVIHVTGTGRAQSRRGICFHHTCSLAPRDSGTRLGIPITSPVRTILDLAAVLPPEALRRVVRQAEVAQLVRHGQLDRRAAASRAKGVTALREVLAFGPAPTRSGLEDRMLDLVVRSGLPRPQVNAQIHLEHASYEVDLLFAAERVVVEVDGAAYHDTRQARHYDATRQAALEAAGYRVLRVISDQVKANEGETLRRLRAALGAPSPAP